MPDRRPENGFDHAGSRPRIPRAAMPRPVRIGLLILAALVLIWLWRPTPASPEALGVADLYLAAEFPEYTVFPPANETRLFGTTILSYRAEQEGYPARINVVLVRQGGRLSVREAYLYLGASEPKRYATWGVTLVVVVVVAYLVFFVSIPRTFGRKCPRDLTLLTMTERVAVPSQIHTSGIGMAPILERTYACRTCDFRHCEALIDGSYRASVPSSWIKVPNWYIADPDGMAEKWERERMARAITDEQYQQLLADAKEAARAKSSSDSPWLYR